ncbi:MAG: hypothetical protein WBZ48_07090 [Bacteroidota bacterium]
MENDKKGMRSIWYFVGLILSAIGVIEIAAGISDLCFPSSQHVRLSQLHANLWWGIAILITGLIYVVKNRDNYVEF